MHTVCDTPYLKAVASPIFAATVLPHMSFALNVISSIPVVNAAFSCEKVPPKGAT